MATGINNQAWSYKYDNGEHDRGVIIVDLTNFIHLYA